jgi:hypothetical protein
MGQVGKLVEIEILGKQVVPLEEIVSSKDE